MVVLLTGRSRDSPGATTRRATSGQHRRRRIPAASQAELRVETEAGCPASVPVAGGLSTVKFNTCGTVIAAAMITGADPAVTGSLR